MQGRSRAQDVGRQTVRAFAEGTPLDVLRRIAAGEVDEQPMSHTCAMRLLEVDEGEVLFSCRPAPRHLNYLGVIHGGFAATLLDSAAVCAVMTMLGPGVGCTTLDLRCDYLRAIQLPTAELRCVGRVVRVGRRVATARAELRAADGRLHAEGTVTCLIVPPPSDSRAQSG